MGHEDGTIEIFRNSPADPSGWKLDITIDKRYVRWCIIPIRSFIQIHYLSLAHVDQIHRLSWRPQSKYNNKTNELASCSEDGTLKILIIQGQWLSQFRSNRRKRAWAKGGWKKKKEIWYTVVIQIRKGQSIHGLFESGRGDSETELVRDSEQEM